MKTAIVIVCLAGCNQVFDLRATVSIDAAGAADVDDDGVGDTVDNCPTISNGDQANADGDGFGDACDTCPLTASSSAHDDDRDHMGDDCDPCPGMRDFGVDGDGDGVGDLCDPAVGTAGQPNHRGQFDPFVALPADWVSSTVAWQQADDAIAPITMLASTDPGLQSMSISTPAGSWMVTIGLESRTHWDSTDSFSIVAENADDHIECIVTCATSTGDTTSCTGRVVINGAQSPGDSVVPRPSMTLSIVVPNFGSPNCRFGSSSSIFAGARPTDGMRISIKASPRIRVGYVDYVQ
jgi:hypothetical protein